MTTPADEDEFTELVDADFPRIDLVGKGANGIPRFLIAKQDGEATGLLDPEFVRDLIGKSDPAERERVTMPSGLTLTGSPADIAAFIHKASERAEPDDVVKAKNDTADRKHKAATGAAMPSGSYPIADEGDLTKAIHAVGRGGASHDAIRKHIITRARSLGASSKIPDNWNSDGSLKEDSVSKSDTVAKDMGPELDDGVDGMDPTVPLAAPDGDAPGDPTDPGSPAWEAIDAATACKWTSILARSRVALDLLAEREMLESMSADPDDAGNACDLQDACCAIDYVIGILAPYAVAEQSESDTGAMEMIGKAMATDLSGPLDAIEALAAVRKAGRVLSGANEAAIRDAAAKLQGVLASLPQAPTAPDSGLPVAKAEETGMPEPTLSTDVTEAAGEHPMGTAEPAPVAKAAAESVRATQAALAGGPVQISLKPGQKASDIVGARVTKADGDGGKPAQVAVYDSKGNLVGVADPADITPLANVAAPSKGDDMDEAAAAPPADMPAEAPADPGDMTPQPAADAGTPADTGGDMQDDDVAKATTDAPITQDVLKSIIAEAVSAALDARTPAEDIAKQADVAAALGEVETLKARLAVVEEQPGLPKVFTNGAVPPASQLRGQDNAPQGGQPVDIAKARELKGTLYHGSGPEQKQAFDAMQQMSVEHLAALHAAGPAR